MSRGPNMHETRYMQQTIVHFSYMKKVLYGHCIYTLGRQLFIMTKIDRYPSDCYQLISESNVYVKNVGML